MPLFKNEQRQDNRRPASWQFFARWPRTSWSPSWFRQRTIGERGELAAVRYLRQAGLKILIRGYRNRFGEIDIIALDGDTLVFIEVKTRRSHSTGHPAEAVDDRKQQQIVRLANAFCRRHGATQCRCRFDIVAVTWPADTKNPTIEHIANAFVATGVGIRSN